MRKVKQKYVSPYPSAYRPVALKRQETNRSQKRYDENTIIWGEDDAFPLRLAKAVQASPAASSCINQISKFSKGAGFSSPEMMKIKVNKTQTLWDLHTEICDTLSLYDGFSANFKYNENGKIVSAYNMQFECLRFVKPEDDLDTDFKIMKYNPYFGASDLFDKKYTFEYPLFDPKSLFDQVDFFKRNKLKFKGQVYYYSRTKPLHRFYSRPDWWSAEKWIYIDGKIQEFHSENLDNGFFSSVLMTIVGDPNAWSTNPRFQETYTDANGVEKRRSTKTVGEEFNDQMSSSFSGSQKAGNVFVQWVLNEKDKQQIQAFPNNTNADLFITLQDLTTKNITIATKTPGILANISEGVSLGSGGSEIQKAVELMQSNTVENRKTLENFYNEILIPNLEPALNEGVKMEAIEIVNYNPISVPVEIEDKFWEVLTLEEKRDFIRTNISSIKLQEPEEQTTVQTDGEFNINDNLKNMTGRQQQQFLRIIKQFSQGKLNEDQAKILLKSGFGFNDTEIAQILNLDETVDPNIIPQ